MTMIFANNSVASEFYRYINVPHNPCTATMASLPTNTSNTTTIAAFTHLLALFAGIVIGKSIDADELNAYRSSSSYYADDVWTRIRRQMKSIIVGGVVLGLLVKTGSAAMGSFLLGSSTSGGGGGGDKNVESIGNDDVGVVVVKTPTPGSRWR